MIATLKEIKDHAIICINCCLLILVKHNGGRRHWCKVEGTLNENSLSLFSIFFFLFAWKIEKKTCFIFFILIYAFLLNYCHALNIFMIEF